MTTYRFSVPAPVGERARSIAAASPYGWTTAEVVRRALELGIASEGWLPYREELAELSGVPGQQGPDGPADLLSVDLHLRLAAAVCLAAACREVTKSALVGCCLLLAFETWGWL